MHEYTVRVSDAEKKALESDVVSLQDWLNNMIHQKARRLIIEICAAALTKDGMLDEPARAQIATELNARGILMAYPSALPLDLREQIVNLVQFKSAAERSQEMSEAE